MRIDKNKIKLQCSLSFMYLTCYVVVKLTGNSRVGKGSGREHLFNLLVSYSAPFFFISAPKNLTTNSSIYIRLVYGIVLSLPIHLFAYLCWP